MGKKAIHLTNHTHFFSKTYVYKDAMQEFITLLFGCIIFLKHITAWFKFFRKMYLFFMNFHEPYVWKFNKQPLKCI